MVKTKDYIQGWINPESVNKDSSVQFTVRVEKETAERVSLAENFIKNCGGDVSRADVLRAALDVGLEHLEAEFIKTNKSEYDFLMSCLLEERAKEEELAFYAKIDPAKAASLAHDAEIEKLMEKEVLKIAKAAKK